MASNNEWAPLPQRKNGTNKKNRENQSKVLFKLKEMFGTSFETDIIKSVAQSCEWKLDASIDALITISSTLPPPKKQQPKSKLPNSASYFETQTAAYDPWTPDEYPEEAKENMAANFLNIDENELLQQQEELRRFEQAKSPNSGSSPQPIQQQNPRNKVETSSLCGLKVQYRPRGMENNSDDDVDVVIEEELSDYRIETPEPDQINVCQFLSQPTQCPPTNTFPKLDYISTPSPPRSPRHKPSSSKALKPLSEQKQQQQRQYVLPPHLKRLENDINKGFKVLVLMRGVPGSGKSYLSREIATLVTNDRQADYIFSSDDYFSMINRGVYLFDPNKLQDAHFYNQNRVLKAMKEGRSPIIADNTNTQAWEMKSYATMAVEHGYIVEIVEPNTPWCRNVHELERRNQHQVPRAKIRSMLDRFEPITSGDRLCRMFSLRYKSCNKPPQKRSVPPLKVDTPEDTLTEKLQNVKIVPDAEKSPELIDNDALNTIAKEYADADVVIESEENDGIKTRQAGESWTEGTSYKEDSFFDLLKLGAIGSERKTSFCKSDTVESRVESNVEVKSETLVDLNDAEEPQDEGNGLSQCWDITLMREKQVESNDESKLEEDDTQGTDENTSSELNDSNVTVTPQTEEIPKKVKEAEPKISDTEEGFEPASKEASTPSDGTSSSFERVSDFEKVDVPMCDTPEHEVKEIVADDKVESGEAEDKNVDNKQKGGLGSLFSFIKNSFMKSEKDSTERESGRESSEEPPSQSSAVDNLTDKLQKSSPSAKKTSTELTSQLLTEASNDTLSPKLSKLNDSGSSDSSADSNLCFETQNSINFSDLSLIDKTAESEEVFFEARETVEIDESTVQKLLEEASSDLLSIEQSLLDMLQRELGVDSEDDEDKTKEEEKEEENEDEIEKETEDEREKICDVVSKMTFIEQMKNLQVIEIFEDDSKMLKEPIDRVLGCKNVLADKMQNTTPPASPTAQQLKPTQNVDQPNQSLTSNLQLISWQSVPFPAENYDKTSTPELEATEAAAAAAAVDDASKVKDGEEEATTAAQQPITTRETFTEAFDFNVAYVGGGVDEYKVIEARSRCINEGRILLLDAADSPPTHKLMLHKGTMTTNTSVIFSDKILDLELTSEDSEDRSGELLERYHYLSRDCIKDIYENLCKRDFDWAVEYLENLQDDDATIYAAIEQLEAREKVMGTGIDADTTEPISFSAPSPQPTRQTPPIEATATPARQARRHHKQSSGESSLQLKQELEGKFVLSEESYKPHTLKVKRWKNRDFGDVKSAGPDAVADLMKFEDSQLMLLQQVGMTPTAPKSLSTSPPLSSSSPQKRPTRLDHPAAVEDECPSSEDSSELDYNDDEEEMMELKLGYDFIHVLESEFGNSNFQIPDGLFPVVQIRRSMAQELHALWIESMQQQLWCMQEQLDAMISKDAEYARSLEEEEEEAAAQAQLAEPQVPNLREIMEMETALAAYSSTSKFRKEIPELGLQMDAVTILHEIFPDYDREMLCQIYEAHERNLEEAIKIIEENCTGKSDTTMAAVLKQKRKNLIDELQKESSYLSARLESAEGQRDEASGGYDEEEERYMTYQDALTSARESREEASRQFRFISENNHKAAEAYRKRNPEVAAYYSDVAKLHIRNMEHANSEAAAAYLAAQMQRADSDDTLDLHYLYVSEAAQALDIYLDHQLSRLSPGQRKQIFIITGRGARSSNGQSRIKPAVARKLNSRNIRFSEVNPGMLKAFLRKK